MLRARPSSASLRGLPPRPSCPTGRPLRDLVRLERETLRARRQLGHPAAPPTPMEEQFTALVQGAIQARYPDGLTPRSTS